MSRFRHTLFVSVLLLAVWGARCILADCIPAGEACNPIMVEQGESSFTYWGQGVCCGQQSYCDPASFDTHDVAAFFGDGKTGSGVCGPDGAAFGAYDR